MPEHSTGDRGVDAWISSLRASRASRSASPDSSAPSGTNEICGLTPFALLERSGPDGVYWRTYQDCLPGLTDISARFCESWPKAGTMRDGVCYLRRKWERRIGVIDFGLLPTPVKADGERASLTYASGNPTLAGAVRLWPTSTSSMLMAADVVLARFAGDDPRRPSYQEAARMWPTPTVHGNHNRVGISATSGDGLATAVKRWPTPTATDADKWNNKTVEERLAKGQSVRLPNQAAGGRGGSLNPTWVKWLMGWPLGWTDLEPLGTDRFRQWLESFGNC